MKAESYFMGCGQVVWFEAPKTNVLLDLFSGMEVEGNSLATVPL